MANKIEVAVGLNKRNFIDQDSRYNASTLLYYGEKRFITFETYKRKKTETTDNDRYYVITKGTEYRPDLVSLRAYANVSLWWKILEANGMKDIWDFKAGTNIVIPAALR